MTVSCVYTLVVFGNIDFHNFYNDSFEEAKMKSK